MSKELFISTTPHETKVAIVEDEQLAEIYFERENEYTLAGSIYQGRVTRVLPGMQSAFVDVGLERDAFLYVTDFMEMEEESDDLEIPPPVVKRTPSREPRQPREESGEGARGPGRRRRSGLQNRSVAPETVIESDLTVEDFGSVPEGPKLAGDVIAGTESGHEGGARRYEGRRRRRHGEHREFADSKFAGQEHAAPASPPEEAEAPPSRRDEAGREERGPARREAAGPRREDTSQGEAENGHAEARHAHRDERARARRGLAPDHSPDRSPRDRFNVRSEGSFHSPSAGEPMVLPGESLQKYGGISAVPDEHQPLVSVAHHKPSTEIDLSAISNYNGLLLPGEKLSKYKSERPAAKARATERSPAQEHQPEPFVSPHPQEIAVRETPEQTSAPAADEHAPQENASASVKTDPAMMRLYVPAQKETGEQTEEQPAPQSSKWFSEEHTRELERIARAAAVERAAQAEHDEAARCPQAEENEPAQGGLLPSEYAPPAPRQAHPIAAEHGHPARQPSEDPHSEEQYKAEPASGEQDDAADEEHAAPHHFAPGEGDIEEIEEEFQEDDFDGIGAAEYAEDEFSIEELEEEETLDDSAHDRRHDEALAAAAQDLLEETAMEAPAQPGSDNGFVLEFDSSDGTEEEEEERTEHAHASPSRARSDRGRERHNGEGERQRRGRVPHGRKNTQRPSLPTISELLKEGQQVLVQIAKEPMAKKGARITSHIALPGRFLVFMPTVSHVGVSRKIGSDEERLRLKRILLSEKGEVHGGFIVRTAAAGASEEDLRADIRFLINLWQEIKSRSENAKPPALIYHDLNLVERVLRDQVTASFSSIWIDSESEYERTVRFLSRFQPQLVKRVKLYSKDTPLYEQFGIQEEINKALKSKVWLKSGGYIVINQTEALVAIDINTGKYVGKTTRLEDTIVKTNIDAIQEIVRQIRLRDLGGIIVIDFIDMDERKNRQKVMQALEEALKKDRAPSKVLQFNDFGLVAITRKRVKQSLERTLGSVCNTCTGTGFVKSATTVCNEIYIEMRKMAKTLEHHDVMLRVNPEVVKALKTNNARWLQDMEDLTRKTIIVKSDPTLHQEQFDIR